MRLVTVSTSVTYAFKGDGLMWANCTVNDTIGELSIQSDCGSWSHRWNAHPTHLVSPSLTAFIARGDVDYLANKLNGRGTRWSLEGTVKELRKLLCARRLADGRDQLANRLEPDDMPDGKPLSYLGGRYTGKSDCYTCQPTSRVGCGLRSDAQPLASGRRQIVSTKRCSTTRAFETT